MSKRTNIFEQGKPESPYNDRDEGPVEIPQRATAAQLAARKIKTLKGPRRAQNSSPGLSQSAAPQQQQQQSSGFGFGATAPIGDSSANSFGLGSQQQSTPGGGAFGGSATSSFPPAQAPTPNNAFANSSFPSFGGDNANVGSSFNPQPPSGPAFNFSVGGANPFAAFAPAPAPALAPATNGSGQSGFSSSVFSMPAAQNQPASNPFAGFTSAAQNNIPPVTTTTSSPFGTSMAPTAGIFDTSGTQQPSMFETSGTQETNMFESSGTQQSSMFETSGTQTPSIFGTSGSQQSSIFETSGTQQPSMFGTSMFGTSGTQQTNMFGATSSDAQSSNSTPTAAPASNFFGGLGSTPSTPAPAAMGGFFNFGASTKAQESTPASQSNVFGGLNAATPAPASNAFTGFGSRTQKISNPAVPENTTNFFFGSTPQANNATNTASDNTPSKANTAPVQSPFNFGSTTPKAPESQPPTNMFSFTPSKPAGTEIATPKPDMFAGLSSTPQPQSSTGGFFGQSQKSSQPDSTTVEYPSLSAPLEASKTPFSFTPQNAVGSSTQNAPATTPSLQPAKANPFAGLPRSPSPTKEPAPTAPSLQPPKANPFASLARSPSPSKESAPPAPSFQPPKANAFAGFARSPSPSNAPAPTPATPTSTMPTLTGVTAAPPEAPKVHEIPQIPKAHIPASWPRPSVGNMTNAANLDQTGKTLVDLAAELCTLNQKFREKINNLPPMADWAALSSWHYKESSQITKKIITVKKQRAGAKGVTGTESALSTKRKVTEEAVQDDGDTTTPTKRFRGGDGVSTPPPQQPPLFSTTPKALPPTSQTSNLFGNILKNGPVSTPAVASSNTFTTEGQKASNNSVAPSSGFQVPSFGNTGASSSSKLDTTPQSGFHVPSFGSSFGTDAKKDDASKSGFQVPAFGKSNSHAQSKTNTTSQSGFKVPSFGSANGTSDFASQFAKSAMTAEQLAAERKKKAMDEDYDSDDETKEQWSARYDKQEAARKAEENAKIKAASGFKMSTATKDSTSSTPASKSFFSISKPASGTSTPGLFGSRAGSPAPSTSGGQSVFDTPPVSNTPSNIFGHLSSGPPSSNNQDESTDEEDDGEQTEGQSQADQPTNSARSSPPPKRKYAQHQQDSGSESEESLEEIMRRKKQETASARPSLLSRMTRADNAGTSVGDSEKDKDQSQNGPSVFGQSNGVKTPAKQPFFFDFSKAGSQTAPPKDNTFKEGTPIKFGDAPATETKGVPIFNFQPATPSPAEVSSTPTKPPPFLFLAANTSSGPGSTSGVSSRAGTPSSEVDTSGKDSAAENDDEDVPKTNQLDLSDLTDAERDEYDIVFHTELAIAKRQVQKGGQKAWENFARGALWILENKDTGKTLLRMRLPSGSTPVNYNLLPKLQARPTGNSQKMVLASYPGQDDKLSNIIFAVKNQEVANEFADVYNSHLPTS